MTELKTWIDLGRNSYLPGDKEETWYVSFNSGNHLIPMFAADNNGEETALCKGGKYYILNGDFRKEYEKLIDKGFNACKKFFDANIDKKSSWSN